MFSDADDNGAFLASDWLNDLGQLSGWSAEQTFSPWGHSAEHDGVVGTPDADAAHWVHQTTDFTCAVVSQQMILKEFGIEISEAQLVYDATTHGWLHAGGTSPSDVGRLLESHGITCHARQGADVEVLLAELAHGHKIIAGVDGGELWQQDSFFEDWFMPNGADHAVVVTGLDMRDPNHPLVILNDPGQPHGAGISYPLEEFLDAWSDSGHMYVATDHAPDDLASHSVFGPNFHPDTGLYMDLMFWAAFLAGVLSLAHSAPEQFALNEDAWSGSNTSAGNEMVDAWATLDDAARNNLFLAI